MERKISPIFRIVNDSNISPNSSFVVNLESEPYGKYKPFNFLMVSNFSSNYIELIVDGGFLVKKVPPSTIIKFDYENLPAFRQVAIRNLGSSDINAGDIEILVQKVIPKELYLLDYLLKLK